MSLEAATPAYRGGACRCSRGANDGHENAFLPYALFLPLLETQPLPLEPPTAVLQYVSTLRVAQCFLLPVSRPRPLSLCVCVPSCFYFLQMGLLLYDLTTAAFVLGVLAFFGLSLTAVAVPVLVAYAWLNVHLQV